MDKTIRKVLDNTMLTIVVLALSFVITVAMIVLSYFFQLVILAPVAVISSVILGVFLGYILLGL